MGRILKRGPGREAGEQPGDLVAQARARAEGVLEEARAEAERIRAAARTEAEAAILAARAGGAERAVEERSRLVAELEEEVVELALAIAGRVLRLAADDPRAARESARRALAQAGGCGRLVLRCHPADEAGLAELAGELPPDCGGPVTVQGDPAVGKGGVLLETEAGAVDARLERQLERLGRGLREAR